MSQHQESFKVVYLLLHSFAVRLIGSCDTVLVVLESMLAINFHLTDVNYADDAVIFTDDLTKWDYVFRNFEESAGVMGLHTN